MARTLGVFALGASVTVDPLFLPLTENSGIKISPVVTKKCPFRRLSSTLVQPSSKRGPGSASRS